jgi:hypothetical protein
MKKMKLKGCDRCGGDLFLDESDRESSTMVCLQCGAEFTSRSADTRVLLRRAPFAARAA